MTCAQFKEPLVTRVGRRWEKVYFMQHDDQARNLVHVLWPKTKHISRVPKRNVRRPKAKK